MDNPPLGRHEQLFGLLKLFWLLTGFAWRLWRKSIWMVLPALLLVACSGTTPSSSPPALAPGQLDATVIRTIDGDTLEVRLHNGSTDRVRLLAVDAPETGQPNNPKKFPGVTDAACLDTWGVRAARYVHERLANQRVILEQDPKDGPRDRFGRLLAYLVLGDADFNALLVEQGYARVHGEGKASRKQRYLTLQQKARKERVGLWACQAPSEPGTSPALPPSFAPSSAPALIPLSSWASQQALT